MSNDLWLGPVIVLKLKISPTGQYSNHHQKPLQQTITTVSE
jgi:hypothetical protein